MPHCLYIKSILTKTVVFIAHTLLHTIFYTRGNCTSKLEIVTSHFSCVCVKTCATWCVQVCNKYFPNKNGRFITRRPVIHKIVSSMYLAPYRDSNQIKINEVKLGIEPFIRKVKVIHFQQQ